jgi:hypothetical protein
MALVNHYNGPFANGKWAHFMDQPVLGYTSWRDPPVNSLRHLSLLRPDLPVQAGIGVAVEGSEVAAGATAALPRFDALNRQRAWFEVFEKGRGVTEVRVQADQPWILVSPADEPGIIDRRFDVAIDWERAPPGLATGVVSVATAGNVVTTISIEALTPEVTRDTLNGFAESAGVISIEPEHFTRSTAVGAYHWQRVVDYGRTLSGMRAEAPVDAASAIPGSSAPVLEYRIYLQSAGPLEITAITAPTLNFLPDQGLAYAVSIDDEPPQRITLVPQGYQAQNRNAHWEKSVGDNAHQGKSKHTIAAPGYHTLKIWMVDPAVVLQKLVVDAGGLKPSYLGPPESYFTR